MQACNSKSLQYMKTPPLNRSRLNRDGRRVLIRMDSLSGLATNADRCDEPARPLISFSLILRLSSLLSLFLVASLHLYKRTCPSVRPLVRPLVMLLSKLMKNGLLGILSDWDEWSTRKKEEQGGRRDEEEGGARRKEQRGGRSDEDGGVTRRVKK